jgi:hypothetical protein
MDDGFRSKRRRRRGIRKRKRKKGGESVKIIGHFSNGN